MRFWAFGAFILYNFVDNMETVQGILCDYIPKYGHDLYCIWSEFDHAPMTTMAFVYVLRASDRGFSGSILIY